MAASAVVAAETSAEEAVEVSVPREKPVAAAAVGGGTIVLRSSAVDEDDVDVDVDIDIDSVPDLRAAIPTGGFLRTSTLLRPISLSRR